MQLWLDGSAAFNRNDYAAAMRLWRPFAEQGDAVTQMALGWMYENGRGVPQDDAEAVKWYRLAASQGHATGQRVLGWMYETGRGVPQDYAEAGRWYRLAAEQGEAIAQESLRRLAERERAVAAEQQRLAEERERAAAAERQRLAEEREQLAIEAERLARERERLDAQAAAVARDNPRPPQIARPLGRRSALVIGNSAYQTVPRLANPTRDATAVADALTRLGFDEVELVHDLTKGDMQRALVEFGEKASGADWALVYFAGHGIEMDGQNYLIPVDAELKQDRHVRLETISLDDLLDAAGGARQLTLVILDACRVNPFVAQMTRTVATRSIGRGLARVRPAAGELVGFAAREGQLALDGDGPHSPFVAALLQHMEEPGVDLRLMFDKVRDSVLAATNGAQEPFTYSSLPAIELSFSPVE